MCCTTVCVVRLFLSTFGEVVLQHNSPQALTSESLEITCFLATSTCFFFFSSSYVRYWKQQAQHSQRLQLQQRDRARLWGEFKLTTEASPSSLHVVTWERARLSSFPSVSINQTEPSLSLLLLHIVTLLHVADRESPSLLQILKYLHSYCYFRITPAKTPTARPTFFCPLWNLWILAHTLLNAFWEITCRSVIRAAMFCSAYFNFDTLTPKPPLISRTSHCIWRR